MQKEYILKKFTKNDFKNYNLLVSNEAVMEMITERAIPLDEARKDYEKILENNKLNELLGNFQIIEKQTDSFVGLAKLEIEDKISKKVELGYMLLPSFWGKGIASIITKELIKKAKEIEELNLIYAIIDPANLASRKILLNNDFESVEKCTMDGLPAEVLNLKL